MGLLFEMVQKRESHRDQDLTYSQENTKSINVQELSTLFVLQTGELRKQEYDIIRGN